MFACICACALLDLHTLVALPSAALPCQCHPALLVAAITLPISNYSTWAAQCRRRREALHYNCEKLCIIQTTVFAQRNLCSTVSRANASSPGRSFIGVGGMTRRRSGTPLIRLWQGASRLGCRGSTVAVEAAAEGEARWLGPVLPEQAAALVAALLTAVFSRTDKSFRMRLSGALSLGALPGACLSTA